ncbi:hypothetical protein PIB30_075378 [Stylosanthes scabra]|uniref:Putative plant transposon protein domain-containing protein n=1 Tax=Stylosanthes scabra TaxID=79078 RepID=A0ABU6SR83_9FABA|nr:hypothetical protein [Stylosanthes scabra]
MSSSSSIFNMLDEHCFRTMFNQNLYEELVSKKKITPEITFDLEDDEYPSIKEQIALRGWRRLAGPRTKVSKWMIQEFYANAVQSEEEMEQADQHPYKSYVRGVEVDFSPENIKRVLRFKDNTPGAATDYTTRLNSDQRLDEVLQDLCITGATWRAILIHAIIKGEDIRVEELIADNIAVIAQGMQGKRKLAFPSTIFKLCKDAEVPMHEFKRSELIPQDKLITTRLMETTRFGRNVHVQQHNEEEEDQPMPQFEGGNEEDHNQGQYQHFQPQYQQPEAGFQQHYWEQQQQGFHQILEQLASMQLQQQQFFENMQSTQAQYLEELKSVKTRQDELWNNTNRFHHQIRKEQDMLAREIYNALGQRHPSLSLRSRYLRWIFEKSR